MFLILLTTILHREEVIGCKGSGATLVGGVSGIKIRRISWLASIPGPQRRGTGGSLSLTVFGVNPAGETALPRCIGTLRLGLLAGKAVD